MTFVLSEKSLKKLEGVHPDLVGVVKRAIELSTQDFLVQEGLRNLERQKELLKQGATQTLASRHLTGYAVDLLPYPVSFDWVKFFPIADAMKAAAKELGVKIRWGGNWRVLDIGSYEGTALSLHKEYTGSFPDGPHFELVKV